MTMKAGTETGSLVNHVLSGATQPTPEIGMGATILSWTDRTPGTVVDVIGKRVYVQEDRAVRTDSNGMSESQDYELSQDLAGKIHLFNLTKRGYRNDCNNGLALGRREKYYDYSF